MAKTTKAAFAIVLLAGSLAGCGTSPLLKGNEAFRDGEFVAAQAHWKPLAEAGHVSAQHNLGVLYKNLGDFEAATFWWEQAVAREFVPSMLQLGALKLAAGEAEEAVALYRRAARWGSTDAIADLEAWGIPVPRADLRMAHLRRLDSRQARIAGQISNRRDPNEFLNRQLDYYAAMLEND